jgi:rod shape-determining protein MreD
VSPPSPRRGTVTIAVSFLVALMLTALPLPHWAEPWRPAWVTLVLAYWVLALPHRVGVGVGWGLGLLLDVLTGALLGQHALSLSLVAFLALRLHQRLRVLSPWEQGVSIFLLVVLDRALSLWVTGIQGMPTEARAIWAPALTSTLLWPWLFVVLRDVRRRYQVS